MSTKGLASKPCTHAFTDMAENLSRPCKLSLYWLNLTLDMKPPAKPSSKREGVSLMSIFV